MIKIEYIDLTNNGYQVGKFVNCAPNVKRLITFCAPKLKLVSAPQIGKFAECAGDLSYVQIVCAAAFVSLNNSSIVSFCCFTKISRLEPWLKFKVRGREIGRARQTFQSGHQN